MVEHRYYPSSMRADSTRRGKSEQTQRLRSSLKTCLTQQQINISSDYWFLNQNGGFALYEAKRSPEWDRVLPGEFPSGSALVDQLPAFPIAFLGLCVRGQTAEWIRPELPGNNSIYDSHTSYPFWGAHSALGTSCPLTLSLKIIEEKMDWNVKCPKSRSWKGRIQKGGFKKISQTSLSTSCGPGPGVGTRHTLVNVTSPAYPPRTDLELRQRNEHWTGCYNERDGIDIF